MKRAGTSYLLCKRPQHQQDMWETRSLNWAQFMLQWFRTIRFPEFTDSCAPFRKNSNESFHHTWLDGYWFQQEISLALKPNLVSISFFERDIKSIYRINWKKNANFSMVIHQSITGYVKYSKRFCKEAILLDSSYKWRSQ